ncbi:MAG: hypothetical protein ACE5HM_08380 [Acidiferrobacterales bacterium]
MAKLSTVKVNLKLPLIGSIEGTWEPDENERRAAWELYVELITRVSIAREDPTEGTLREALSSLYTLFDTTRKILREYGPSVAQPKGGSGLSFGYLAVAILNSVLRPFLSKWHVLLLDFEATRAPGTSTVEHEKNWGNNQDLRNEMLVDVRQPLLQYANLLAEVAGVPPLVS